MQNNNTYTVTPYYSNIQFNQNTSFQTETNEESLSNNNNQGKYSLTVYCYILFLYIVPIVVGFTIELLRKRAKTHGEAEDRREPLTELESGRSAPPEGQHSESPFSGEFSGNRLPFQPGIGQVPLITSGSVNISHQGHDMPPSYFELMRKKDEKESEPPPYSSLV